MNDAELRRVAQAKVVLNKHQSTEIERRTNTFAALLMTPTKSRLLRNTLQVRHRNHHRAHLFLWTKLHENNVGSKRERQNDRYADKQKGEGFFHTFLFVIPILSPLSSRARVYVKPRDLE